MSQPESRFIINFIDGPLKGQAFEQSHLQPFRVPKTIPLIWTKAASQLPVVNQFVEHDIYNIKTYIHSEKSTRTIPLIKPDRFCSYHLSDFSWLKYCRLAKSEHFMLQTRFHVASCSGFSSLKFNEDWKPTDIISELPYKQMIDWQIAPWFNHWELELERCHAISGSKYFGRLIFGRFMNLSDQFVRTVMMRSRLQG